MNCKFLLLVFIFILSISAVNAQDNVTDDMSVFDDPVDHVALDDYQITDETGNFTDLNDQISKIEAGGNFTLQKDYKYNSNDSDYKSGIIIDQDNIVIDGDGHSIDGAGQARIFEIVSNNVTLKNINFINGYSSVNGGAISAASNNLNVLDCMFNNNTAISLGGAVYIGNSFSNSKINSTFINNTALAGGAIYFRNVTTNVTINGYFDGNVARRGGAISFNGVSINNTIASSFYNNRANQASGGAIFFYKFAKNNLFENIFRYNYGVYGGGIFFYSNSNDNKFRRDFRFNTAKSCGGAIFFYNNTNNNSFSGYFINNTALGEVDAVNGNGGAITFKGLSTNCVFTCDFVNNTAVKTGGGVNYRLTPSNITFNSNFINNKAETGGGVNFIDSFENVVFNGEFIGNMATYGGAMAAKNGVVENISFWNNHAETGGAIYFDDDGTVRNSNFCNNAAKSGGAIYFKGNGTIDGCTFTNNSAEDGGAVLACGNLSIYNSRFENNSATLGTNHISLKGQARLILSNVIPQSLEPYYIGHLTIIDAVNVTYGETVIINVNITDNDNNPLNNGTITCIVDGRTYTANVENGIAKIEIPNLDAGNYDANLTYTGNEYVAISQAKFGVLKQDVVIGAANKAYIINYGGKYSITLYDVNGSSLSGKTLTVTLNGKSIKSSITNVNGISTVSLTPNILKSLKAGNKKLVIKFSDSNYNSKTTTAKITVNKEKTRVVAKSRILNKNSKTKQYTMVLKDSKGKAVKKVIVALIVNGKTYKLKTNSKGQATFKITNLNKKGKFNAIVKFTGNYYYKASSKKVYLTTK